MEWIEMLTSGKQHYLEPCIPHVTKYLLNFGPPTKMLQGLMFDHLKSTMCVLRL